MKTALLWFWIAGALAGSLLENAPVATFDTANSEVTGLFKTTNRANSRGECDTVNPLINVSDVSLVKLKSGTVLPP